MRLYASAIDNLVMDYFPLFARLKNSPCLIIGGGDVALRKVKLLRRAGAQITVVALEVHAELAKLAATGDIILRQENFNPAETYKYRLIVAATNDPLINQSAATAAADAGVFCNVVDDRTLSTVIMPAIVDRAPLIIAVSSGGQSPVLATRIRQQLEYLFPPALADLANFAGKWREAVKKRFSTTTQRLHFWQQLLDGPIARQVMAGEIAKADENIASAIAEEPSTEGFAWIVGAGPGDPELLTLKAARVLASADTILHDRLISASILNLARKDAEFIAVGKQAGMSSVGQDEINALLIERVRAGNTVCRLKGGDPLIFGRGGEEIAALDAAGLPWQIIPGITAAVGCAAAAGVPLTHRNVARSVSFITAFTTDESEPDWQSLCHSDQTIVFYMAASKLAYICNSLIAAGKPDDCPALLVENGTTDRQRMFRGTLKTLPSLTAKTQVKSPAILMIGLAMDLAKIVANSDAGPHGDGNWAPAASANR